MKDFPEARDCLLKLRCAGHTKTFKMKKTFTEACETQVGMGERVVGFVHLHLEGQMPRFQEAGCNIEVKNCLENVVAT